MHCSAMHRFLEGTAMSVTENRYLQGNYAPVPREVTALDLEVSGTIPDHLDGRYLRIGPNPIGPTDPAGYHWFMGAGMVHGVRLRDGKAEWYRNRWVRTPFIADPSIDILDPSVIMDMAAS